MVSTKKELMWFLGMVGYYRGFCKNFSTAVTPRTINCLVVEKEALALVWALQHFTVFVGPDVSPLVVYTDHNSLSFLQTSRCPNHYFCSLMISPSGILNAITVWLRMRCDERQDCE